MDFGIIQKLAKCIVRPPKSTYDIKQLTPACFQMKFRIYDRQDFTVMNGRNLKLQGTLIKARHQPQPRPIIVFLHANGSSRLIMKNYLDVFLPLYDMASFDFAACGASEGQFISLGYNEREDVHYIISHLKRQFKVKNVILWGRSMGAATALLYSAKYGGVSAVISDNSFSDLQLLVNELSDDYLPFLPSFLLQSIIDSIQQYIQGTLWKKELTDFNLRKLKPINVVEKVECPVFYVGSKEDTFVNVNHTKALYNRTKAAKYLELVSGNHNDMRTRPLKEKILIFLKEHAKTVKPSSFGKEKTNIYLIHSFDLQQLQKKKAKQRKGKPDSAQTQLINCAELELQAQKMQRKTTKLEGSPKQELPTSFIPKLSALSSPTRQSILSKQGNGAERVFQRSRSKIKRKKIFQGIGFINQHLNGSQN